MLFLLILKGICIFFIHRWLEKIALIYMNKIFIQLNTFCIHASAVTNIKNKS